MKLHQSDFDPLGSGSPKPSPADPAAPYLRAIEALRAVEWRHASVTDRCPLCGGCKRYGHTHCALADVLETLRECVEDLTRDPEPDEG